MKLLITGGAGFIGSNFIHYILKKYPDYHVINLDVLNYAGNLENLKEWENSSRYRFVKGDIIDRYLVNDLVKEVDAIVHFAAESHVDRSITGPDAFIRSNILGTYNLLNAAKNNGEKRFHHISTDEVFGSLKANDPAFHEKTPYDPRSPYSASKASSDHLVKAYFHTYGLPVTISNCSNNYGPYHFPEKFIPLAITNLLEGKKVPVYGDGKNMRDWLYVEDHCEAIDLILHKGKIGETYNVGGNNERTNLEVVRKIVKILIPAMGGKNESSNSQLMELKLILSQQNKALQELSLSDVRNINFETVEGSVKINVEYRDKGANINYEKYIEFVKDRPGHDYRYSIDYTKIKNELGWEPKTGFEEGLRKTIEWYRSNQEWWQKIKSGEYKSYYAKQYGK